MVKIQISVLATVDLASATVTSAADQISGDAVSGGTIGTTAITSLAGNLSLGDNNITNVGALNCVLMLMMQLGLDIVFGGNTNLDKISLTDNLADALNITEGSNSYLKFVTDSSESIVFGKNTDFGSLTVDLASAVTFAADQISGDSVSGGTIGTTAITALAGNLSLGDNNITNVGALNYLLMLMTQT